MKKIMFLLTLFFVTSFLFCQTNIPGGTHNTSETWSLQNHPYIVQGDVSFTPGTTLTIEPGVSVKFAENSELNIYGIINAIGTLANPILFYSEMDHLKWEGIHLFNTDSSTLSYCNITDSKAGGINITNSSNIDIINCNVSNNTSNLGAGVNISSNSNDILIRDCIIENNSYNIDDDGDPIGGGGISSSNSSDIIIIDCLIKKNVNRFNGGGISLYECSYSEISENIISENNSATEGGGIYIGGNNENIDNLIQNNEIFSNTSVWRGGGVSLKTASSVCDNNIYDNSTNGDGGGICMLYWSVDRDFTDNQIHHNIAGGSGGGINAYGIPKINNCEIFSNTAISYGGGVNLSSSGYQESNASYVEFNNCEIHDNTSSYLGGGLYLIYCTPNITKTIIRNNSADIGGAIFLYATVPYGGHPNGLIKECVITENYASSRCGGVYADTDTYNSEIAVIDFYNSIIYNNTESGNTITDIHIETIQGSYMSYIKYNCITPNGLYALTSDLVDIEGTIFQNPEFVNPDNFDYHLLPNSPCIDTGNPDWQDPDETRSDIGRYYYHQEFDNRNFSGNEWNWVSFPRLEVDINGNQLSSAVLSNLQPQLPSFIDIDDQEDEGQTYDGLTQEWNPDNYSFDRVSGYKINFIQSRDLTLSVRGERVAENIPVTLYVDQENWVGYFCENSSSPVTAFENIWDDFKMIKHKDWCYYRLVPDGTIYNTLHIGDIRPGMKYGEMAVVEMFRQQDLIWNYDNAPIMPYPESGIFTYEEKADYTPIHVEMEEGIDATEVGVFVNNECKGFGIVTEDETMIRAYLDETRDGGGEIEFVYYNDDRSNSKVSNYSVYDTELKAMVKRIIDSRENRDSYNVSLRENGSSEMVPKPKLAMSAYPNPFNPTTNISFYIPETEEARIEIYNIKGQKVKTLFNGVAHSGKNILVWKGVNESDQAVSSGIYFCRISTSKNKISKKLMLLK